MNDEVIAEKAIVDEQQEEPRKEITVGEVLNEVQTDIDSLQDDITKKFQDRRNSLLIAKQRKEYFIVKNKFWDMWFQKLFAQVISVKIWVMILITILLGLGLITNMQFASILGIIMGLKGTFSVAEVWRNNREEIEERSIIKRV